MNIVSLTVLCLLSLAFSAVEVQAGKMDDRFVLQHPLNNGKLSLLI